MIQQTSASAVYIDGLEYLDTVSENSLIVSESSLVYFNNITFVNVTSASHFIECTYKS